MAEERRRNHINRREARPPSLVTKLRKTIRMLLEYPLEVVEGHHPQGEWELEVAVGEKETSRIRYHPTSFTPHIPLMAPIEEVGPPIIVGDHLLQVNEEEVGAILEI